MDRSLRGQTYDLSSIIGCLVSRFRGELGLTQAELADRLGFDRSLLVRIETGRNTANIDHIFLVEEVLIREDLIGGHGDLSVLAAKVARRLRQRGATPVYGMLPKPEKLGEVENVALGRIVVVVMDEWMERDRSLRDPELE